MSVMLLACGANSGNDPDPVTPPQDLEYSNPVYAPIFADPSVIKHEGVYYAYGTEDYGEWIKNDNPLDNVSNVQCVPILQSTNMIDWYFAGSAFKGLTKPSWGSLGANVWAPDIVKVGNKFHLYYSLSKWGDEDPGIGVAVADHPLGPWQDKGKLFTSLEIGVDNSIDPTVYYGQDGKLYMVWGSFRGLFGVQLTDDGLGLYGGIEYASANKILVAGIVGSWNGNTYEAPYIIYKDDYYYMFVSSGTCCDGFNSTYNVRVSRSKNPLGPFVDDKGQDMKGELRGKIVVQSSNEFAGPGHNGIMQDDDGNYFIAYHAFDTSKPSTYGQNANRRAFLIDKLEWDSNGWVTVKDQKPGSTGLIAPVINN